MVGSVRSSKDLAEGLVERQARREGGAKSPRSSMPDCLSSQAAGTASADTLSTATVDVPAVRALREAWK